MSRHTPQALAPRYFSQFRCTGSSCPQSCCNHWRVTIDKATWKKYRQVRIQPLAEQLRRHVQQNAQPTTAVYGTIQLREDGGCQFLDEARLCSIQGALGHGALSSVCQTYPRKFHQLGDQWHAFASTSCPEIARLVITDPQALELAQEPLSQYANSEQIPFAVRLPQATLHQQAHTMAAQALRDKLLWLCGQDRIGGVDVLKLWVFLARQVAGQQRDCAAQERASPLDEEDALNRRLSGLADVLDRFTADGVQTGLNLLADMPRFDDRSRIGVLLKSIELITVMSESLQGVLQGILFKALKSTLEDVETVGWPAVLALEKAHPWAIKNLIQNSLWERSTYTRVFDGDGLENALLMLVVRVALMRFLLSTLACSHPDTFGLDDMQTVVYALSRPFDHNEFFVKELLNSLEHQGIRSLATAMALL